MTKPRKPNGNFSALHAIDAAGEILEPLMSKPGNAFSGNSPAIRAIGDAAETIEPLKIIPGGGEPPPGGDIRQLVDMKDHLQTAKIFMHRCYMWNFLPLIVHYNGAFHTWRDRQWSFADELQIRNQLYHWTDGCVRRTGEDTRTKCLPNARWISNLMDALKAAAALDVATSPPFWMPPGESAQSITAADQPDAAEFLALPNGLLHLPTGEFSPPTPAYFSLSGCAVPYVEGDPPPHPTWLKCLAEWFGTDKESIEVLQEIAGCIVTGDTSFQKIFLLQGAPRSGKSTIANVLRALIGDANVAAPRFATFGTAFALEKLIGKRLTIMSDARAGKQSDQQAILENLLAISGRDFSSVDRKHRSEWNGRLDTSFLLVSNELPRLGDASGAFAARVVMIVMPVSYLGREDEKLFDRLTPELPAILRWALEGYARLKARGRFQAPRSSAEALRTLATLGSEFHEFLRDQCLQGEQYSIPREDLYHAYVSWRTDQGFDGKPNKVSFGRTMQAACPTARVVQRRPSRVRVYEGIALRPSVDDLPFADEPE